MAVFRPAVRPSDLPEIGAARETGTYDFKGNADPNDARELAKDVAAFANAFGGVVLVGAVEDDTTHTLKEYSPLPRAFADKLTTAYELAVRDRCDPPPVVDVVPLELPPALGTGFVVAVNVRPMPLGPVGVRADKGESFAFPLRTVTHTKYLKPTELAMLMIPEIRRVAILLDSIPEGQRDDIEWIFRSLALNDNDTLRGTLMTVDSHLTTVTVFVAPGVLSANREVVTLPLDRMRSVWRRDDTHWCVEVEGFFSRAPGRFAFVPPYAKMSR